MQLASEIDKASPAFRRFTGWHGLVLSIGVMLGSAITFGIHFIHSGESAAGYVFVVAGLAMFYFMYFFGSQRIACRQLHEILAFHTSVLDAKKNVIRTTGDFVAPNLSSGSYSENRNGSGDQ